MGAMTKLGQDGFSLGLELPLDNDWSSMGRQAHAASGRVPGEPDLHQHAALAQQSPAWIGAQMDGWLAYPGTPEDHARRAAGVQHIGLQLRQNRRPLAETLQEIAHYVLPVFHGTA